MFKRLKKGTLLFIITTLMMIVMIGCGSMNSTDDFKNEVESKLEQKELSDAEKEKQSNEIYNGISKKATESYYGAFDQVEGTPGTAGMWLWKIAMGAYQKFVDVMPIIIFISILSGGITLLVARNNRSYQRFAVLGLIFGIPGLLVVLNYVVIPLLSTAA